MITVTEMSYVFPDGTVGIQDASFALPDHSRTLLIGANGGGKSTLLKVIAGKTLAKQGKILVDNKDPFRDSLGEAVRYLGTEWAANPVVHHDIAVVLLLSSIGGDEYPERRDLLIDILDIDLRWHMHAVSDGERRRVQLAMGLLKPWTTLLLDEVTVDLDVLVRARLLQFLYEETEQRSCQIVYATHIFDGLSHWPTHIAHMRLGKVITIDEAETVLKTSLPNHSPQEEEAESATRVYRGSSLLELALKWLREDLEIRGDRKPKPLWTDIAESELAGSLEGEGADGFSRYFRASRARA